MKIKSSLLIFVKVFCVVALVWYLPNKVNENVKVIEASTIKEDTQATTTKVTKEKKIYIYNTHQGEGYDSYNVLEGSSYLKECLSQKGYQCDVEANNFEQYKDAHNISYDKSYTVSKMYVEQQVAASGGYDLIIDFHRDSIDKSLSTLSTNQNAYAKLMFVAGKSSGKFDAVNQLSKELSDRINGIVPGLSRGVYLKQSHYNQGISDNMVLIEVGAQSNTKDEVMKSVEVLAQVIDEYLSK